jgi:cytochrome c-type biogenesis protein CcmH/NrfG
VFPGLRAQARSAYARRDWRLAAERARSVLKQSPGDRESLRLLARTIAREGKASDALDFYANLGPDGMEAEDLFLVGKCLLGQQHIEAGQNALTMALDRDPKHAESLNALVELGLKSKDLLEAAGRAERLAAIPSWEVRGSILLGKARMVLADHAKAAAAFERALRLDPELRGTDEAPITVRKNLVRSFLAVGKPTEARTQLERIGIGGNDPEVFWLLSRAMLQQRQVDAATKALERAGSFGRDHPETAEPALFVGSAKCTGCHTDICRSQKNSHHAQSIRTGDQLKEWALPPSPVKDPYNPDVTHTLAHEDGRVVLTSRVGDQTLRAFVDYVMGSGNRARTPVGRDESGAMRELRISYYSDAAPWDLTTGHTEKPEDSHAYLGMPQSADKVRRCLACHTTTTPSVAQATNAKTPPVGVSCERCHGPGGNHLDAIAVGFPVPAIGQPRLSTPEQVVQLCGQCHSPPNPVIAPTDPLAVRLQAATFPWSRCYTETKNGLSCITCHDPHKNVETARAANEAVCLACHTAAPPSSSSSATELASKPDRRHAASLPAGAKRVVCPVEPARDCIRCHMPVVTTPLGHAQRFTDHYIRVHRETTKPESNSASPTERVGSASDRVRREAADQSPNPTTETAATRN